MVRRARTCYVEKFFGKSYNFTVLMEFLSSNQFSEVSTIDTIEILGSRFPEKYENKRRASKTVKHEFDCLGLWIASGLGLGLGFM